MKKLLLFSIVFVVLSNVSYSQAKYWNTVHYENWSFGTPPISDVPFQYITHLIMFAGGTGGSQTNTPYPYWHPPSNFTGAFAQSLVTTGHTYGTKIIVDLGLGGGWDNVANLGDTAAATWAGTVAHYIVNNNFDGGDFDLEGSSPVAANMQRMYHKLRDSLTAINPSKTYTLSASVLSNTGSLTGYGIIGGADPGYQYLDQINPMFYDVSGTYASPLYQDPSCSTWGSDSGVVTGFVAAGLPKAKVGLGYAVQVYHTASTTACPPGGFGGYSLLSLEQQYFPPAAGATVYWNNVNKQSYLINTVSGVKVAYEDTTSTWYKADFIKRKGFGGAMGFCLGRGYLPNPPAGVNKNMAAYGMGNALNGAALPPPPPPADTVKPTITLLSPVNGDTLSGITMLSAQASDNVSVSKVDFLLNGVVLGTVYSSPYNYSWNTASLTGAQTISARASDAAGNSSTTSGVTVVIVPPPPTPPPTPVLSSPLNGATGQSTSMSVVWNASSGATSYHVQVSTNSNFATPVIDDSAVTSTSRQMGPLSAGTTYYWRVSAINSYGLSSYSNSWSFTTLLPPPPDTIPYPSVLRDNFNGPNGPIVGSKKWATIINHPLNGTMVVLDSTITPKADTGYYNFGGVAWDTLMSGGTEASLTLKQKSGDFNYTSLFIYARMNSKDYNTGTGYRLRYFEQSATDNVQIQRVGPGYPNSTVLASVNYEVNPGDVITFRVLSDNKTMEGLINGVKIISATDSAYSPSQWYFAIRACVFPTPVLYDNFSVSSHPSSGLSTPTLLSIANGATGQPVSPLLSWGQQSGAISYRVQVATDSNFSAIVLDDSTITGTTRQIGPLSNNAKYYWHVNAKYAGGTSSYSTVWAFTTIVLSPVSPTLSSPVTGATNQPISLTLSWNQSATATSYRVQVASDSLFGTVVLNDSTVTGTSRQIGPLTNNTKYYWRVSAKNGGGVSTYSSAWNFTTIIGTPSVPTLASPAMNAVNLPTSLTLNWNSSTLASSYRVQVSVDSLFGSTIVNDSTVTIMSKQIVSLANNTKYYWRVNAKNIGGTSSYSTVWNFTTSSGIPALPNVPTLLSPANGTTGQPTNLTLTWSPSTGAASYHVQVSVDSLFSTTVLDDSVISQTSRQLLSLANNMTYFWRVSARNVSGISAYSNVWHFTTVNSIAVLNIDQSALNFGRVIIGSLIKDSIIVGNTGNVVLRVSSIQASDSQYQITPTSLTVSPGSHQIIHVTFTPSQRTTITAHAIIRCDSLGLRDTVMLTGRGIYPARLRHPSTVVLNPVTLSGTAVESLHVANIGDDTLTITSIRSTNAIFTISPTTVNIAPGDSQSLHVTATPTQAQSTNGYFIFTSNSTTGPDTVTVRINSATGIISHENPTEYSLSQNYPNPFNPSTRIEYTLPVTSHVVLKIYNIIGEEISTIVNEVQENGARTAQWSAINREGSVVPSGVYFYRLVATALADPNRSFSKMRKMVILK